MNGGVALAYYMGVAGAYNMAGIYSIPSYVGVAYHLRWNCKAGHSVHLEGQWSTPGCRGGMVHHQAASRVLQVAGYQAQGRAALTGQLKGWGSQR